MWGQTKYIAVVTGNNTNYNTTIPIQVGIGYGPVDITTLYGNVNCAKKEFNQREQAVFKIKKILLSLIIFPFICISSPCFGDETQLFSSAGITRCPNNPRSVGQYAIFHLLDSNSILTIRIPCLLLERAFLFFLLPRVRLSYATSLGGDYVLLITAIQPAPTPIIFILRGQYYRLQQAGHVQKCNFPDPRR